jgi:hypothetical protein
MAGVLKDPFEDAAELTFSRCEKAGGVGVPIDRAPVSDLIIRSEGFWTAPANEIRFDGVAVRVGADAAFAGMA